MTDYDWRPWLRRTMPWVLALTAILAAGGILTHSGLGLAAWSLLCFTVAAWAISPPARRLPVPPPEPAPTLTRAEVWQLGLPHVSDAGELEWAPEGWTYESDPQVRAVEAGLIQPPTGPLPADETFRRRRQTREDQPFHSVPRCSRCGEKHGPLCLAADVAPRRLPAFTPPEPRRARLLLTAEQGALVAKSLVTGSWLPLPLGWTEKDFPIAVMAQEIADPDHVIYLPSGVRTTAGEVRDLLARIEALHR